MLASVVLTFRATNLPPKRQWQACQAVARDYPAYGYFHTHQKHERGGKFAPHIHLFIMLPDERVQLWISRAKADLARRFAPSIIELSNSKDWVLEPDSRIAILGYAANPRRNPEPIPAYWTRSRFKPEQHELDALLSEALHQRTTKVR